jgi:peptidoglycan/xylan/chitin deacetylase (PgdA/CDA1 family)
VAVVAGSSVVATRLVSSRSVAAGIVVTVAGRPAVVASGTTLAGAASRFRLHPRQGDLLDVTGKVLGPDGSQGLLLLDGRPDPGGSPLRSGDRITVVNGRDRDEPLAHEAIRVRAGMPSDPQFTLSFIPGEELVVRGAISHELVSEHFRPTGTSRPSRAVALTFDDGPSPVYTPRILAVLHRLRVRATFFVIGYLAKANPVLVECEQRLGMVVGNHSYNHPEVPPFDRLPSRLRADEISLTSTILARLGVRARLFRPPGGSFSPAVVQQASSAGERIVLWSVDPADWSPGVTAREITHRVLSAVRPGSIVILHDGGGDRSATLAALPAIVQGLRRRGLHLVAVAPGPTTTDKGLAATR